MKCGRPNSPKIKPGKQVPTIVEAHSLPLPDHTELSQTIFESACAAHIYSYGL